MMIKARHMEGFHTTIWRDPVEIDTTKYKCFDGKTQEECEEMLEMLDTDEYPELEDVWEALSEADVTREKYTGEHIETYIMTD